MRKKQHLWENEEIRRKVSVVTPYDPKNDKCPKSKSLDKIKQDYELKGRTAKRQSILMEENKILIFPPRKLKNKKN